MEKEQKQEKKQVTLKLNPKIPQALRKMSTDTGVTKEWFVNDLLEKALSEYLSDEDLQTDQTKYKETIKYKQIPKRFIEWIEKKLPTNKRFYNAFHYKEYSESISTNEKELVTPKRFITWIKVFCKTKGGDYLQGKDAYGRWSYLRLPGLNQIE